MKEIEKECTNGGGGAMKGESRNAATEADRQESGKREGRRAARLACCQRSAVLHLCLWYDGFLCWFGAEEGGERGCNHQGVRPDKAAQITARDRVLFGLKNQSVHSIKLAPRQPHRVLLAQEGGALEPQGQRRTAVSDQVKPGGVCKKRLVMRYRGGSAEVDGHVIYTDTFPQMI